MKTRILAVASLLALASLAVVPIAAEAQNAPRPYAGRGYSGTPPPGGPTRGGGAVVNPGGNYNGGATRGYYANGWRGHPGYGHRPWTSSWRPGWGWGGWGWGVGWNPGWWGPGWGWGGWGWGVGWNPGWWGPGWGWSVGAPVVVTPSVSGAWVLPPSATTFIERDVEATAPPAQPAQQWWYWCASSRAYYPYVETCAETWQRIEPRVPAGTQ